jgi:hypothetical protein
MSYSRWSTSVWYTYWTCFSEDCKFKLPTARLKNNQVFEICDFRKNIFFTYKEIAEDVDACIEQVVEYYSKPFEGKMLKSIDPDGEAAYEDVVHEPVIYSQAELEELRGYMLDFKQDIDEHFRLKQFFLLEWYYPIRNSILYKLESWKK